MKVRIVYNETGTGAEMMFDVEVPELTGEHIAKAIMNNCGEGGDVEIEQSPLTVASFVILDKYAAGIFTSHDSYFGPTLWTAIVYTVFR
jgi:hypothetical protein